MKKFIAIITVLALTMPMAVFAESKEVREKDYEREKIEYRDDTSTRIELSVERLEPTLLRFSWTEYTQPDFKWYKLVMSQQVENPVYPNDKAVRSLTLRSETSAEVNLPIGSTNFRVCVITEDDRRICSNTLTLSREATEEELLRKEERQTEKTETKEREYDKDEGKDIQYAETRFRDHREHWAKMHIERLVKRGIVDAEQQNFRPDDSINRAEAIKMIVLSAGLTPADCDESIFPDLRAADWFCTVVTLAHRKGYVEGDQGRLNPAAPINRAQAMKLVMMAKAVQMDLNNVFDTGFEDVPSAEWYARYVYYGRKMNLIEGRKVDGRHIFDPAAPITRAELSKILDIAFN